MRRYLLHNAYDKLGNRTETTDALGNTIFREKSGGDNFTFTGGILV